MFGIQSLVMLAAAEARELEILKRAFVTIVKWASGNRAGMG